jgi:hypothetical protein
LLVFILCQNELDRSKRNYLYSLQTYEWKSYYFFETNYILLLSFLYVAQWLLPTAAMQEAGVAILGEPDFYDLRL